MKKLPVFALAILSAALILTGCVGLQLGGGSKTDVQKPTIGQQLIDLKKAKDTGAITDSEYQAQKAKVLDSK
jgi:PBP1b-binding outer membrane lipoprotein LpoB